MAISQANRFLESTMKDNKVNAEQWVEQNEKGILQNGVSMTSGLLQIKDSNAIKFAILHEMGHLLTMQFTKTFKLKLSMVQLEVIADLSSVFLMKGTGLSWNQIEQAVKKIMTATNQYKNGSLLPRLP
jgi:hypothetical protein